MPYSKNKCSQRTDTKRDHKRVHSNMSRKQVFLLGLAIPPDMNYLSLVLSLVRHREVFCTNTKTDHALC